MRSWCAYEHGHFSYPVTSSPCGLFLGYLKPCRKDLIMGVVTSGSCIQTLKDVKPPEGAQEAGLFCRSFLEKGEVFAYGGSIQT